jgi:quercetin dioxygenase-like cupin family protein
LNDSYPNNKSSKEMEYLQDMPGHEIVPGFTGRFVHGEHVTLSFVDIKKGSRLTQHQHVHEQVTHILQGEIEMLIGDETFVLKAGAVHVIPSNVPHAAYALTDCKVIDAFTPVREDYRF